MIIERDGVTVSGRLGRFVRGIKAWLTVKGFNDEVCLKNSVC